MTRTQDRIKSVDLCVRTTGVSTDIDYQCRQILELSEGLPECVHIGGVGVHARDVNIPHLAAGQCPGVDYLPVRSQRKVAAPAAPKALTLDREGIDHSEYILGGNRSLLTQIERKKHGVDLTAEGVPGQRHSAAQRGNPVVDGHSVHRNQARPGGHARYTRLADVVLPAAVDSNKNGLAIRPIALANSALFLVRPTSSRNSARQGDDRRNNEAGCGSGPAHGRPPSRVGCDAGTDTGGGFGVRPYFSCVGHILGQARIGPVAWPAGV